MIIRHSISIHNARRLNGISVPTGSKLLSCECWKGGISVWFQRANLDKEDPKFDFHEFKWHWTGDVVNEEDGFGYFSTVIDQENSNLVFHVYHRKISA